MRISQILSNRIINIRQLASLRNPSKLKPNALVSDIFESSKGLTQIRNVRSGDYGAICDGSKPLRPFYEVLRDVRTREMQLKGFSTNTDGWAPSFLKSKADTPLSTSKVHDCSVAYFYNEGNQTHFLFHVYPKMNESTIRRYIRTFMPEGFQKAILVPGDNAHTKVHKSCLPKIFGAIREMNPETSIEVYHNRSRLPEIVGYNGSVYEIRNTEHLVHWNFGQASFRISDIRDTNTLDEIIKARDISSLQKLRETFNLKGYDPEVKKVLFKFIDEKINKLTN